MLMHVILLLIANVVTAETRYWNWSRVDIWQKKYPTYAPSGEPFNVTCEASSEAGGKFLHMRWIDKEGNVIPEDIIRDPGVQRVGENSLTLSFTNPNTEQSGRYRCTGSYPPQPLANTIKIVFYGPKPTFEYPFENITAKEGSKMEVDCLVVADMPVIYEWLQGGIKIPEDPESPIFAVDMGNQSTLTIQKVAKSHEGTYVCTARNEHGLSRKLYQLTVPSPADVVTTESWSSNWMWFNIHIRPRKHTTYAPSGEPYNITCEASTEARGKFPFMTWIDKERNIIPEDIIRDPGVQRVGENSLTLSFTDPNTEQSGSYTCSGSYALQGLERSIKIVFYGPKPTFEYPFENITAKEGSKLEVDCLVVADMPVIYEWLQGGIKVPDDPELPISAVDMGNLSTLTIQKVAKSHEGTYVCTARNEHGLSRKLYSLTVLPSPADVVTAERNWDFGRNRMWLDIRPRKHPTYAPSGEPYNVTCEATSEAGGKFLSMRWIDKDGNVIPEDIIRDPGVQRVGENSLTLSFTDPNTEQSGRYRCTGSYPGQGLEHSIKMVFYGPKPTFEYPFENITAKEGSKMEVDCIVVADMLVIYEWLQGGIKVPDDLELPISAVDMGNQSTLTIQKVAKSHEGTYVCTAKNEHGLSRKLYSLTVLPSPGNETNDGAAESSVLNVEVKNITSTSVEFSIAVSAPVKRIQVKYREISANQRRRSQYSKYHMEWNYGDDYILTALNSSGVYTFQFRSIPQENNQWSKLHTVTLLPDKPELIFESIKDGAIKLKWFVKMQEQRKHTIDGYELKYFQVAMRPNERIKSTCVYTIQIPQCGGSSYTIAGDQSPDSYLEIQLRSHTVSGYGEADTQKVYIPK